VNLHRLPEHEYTATGAAFRCGDCQWYLNANGAPNDLRLQPGEDLDDLKQKLSDR
jgi:hypothetical protein